MVINSITPSILLRRQKHTAHIKDTPNMKIFSLAVLMMIAMIVNQLGFTKQCVCIYNRVKAGEDWCFVPEMDNVQFKFSQKEASEDEAPTAIGLAVNRGEHIRRP